MNVYVVFYGERYYGSYSVAAFSNKESAIKYAVEYGPGYDPTRSSNKTYVYYAENGLDYVGVQEFEVRVG